MKPRIASFVLVLITVLLTVSCGNDTSSTTASFETPTGTGYLRKSNTLWILNLEGSYTDMGRQYGALLKNELATLDGELEKILGRNFSVPSVVAAVKNQMEPREDLLLTGMEQESGLSRYQLERLNTSLFFIYDSGCSAFAATGAQTESGFTIAGRNFDNPRGEFSRILRGNSILVIFNPKDQFTGNGSHRDNSVAIMTQIGWLYGLTTLNSKGIYLEYNNGMNSIPLPTNSATLLAQLSTKRDGLHQNLYAALDADTLEEVDARFAAPVAVATITQVADKSRIWHYERSPDFYNPEPTVHAKKLNAGEARGGTQGYDNPPNMDIFTNHFFLVDWHNQQLIYSLTNDSGSKTFARLRNLQDLAKQPGIIINPATMKEIMTTPLRADGTGGPFIPTELDSPDVTHFTSVTDIANKIMHIYPYVDTLPDAPHWSVVDLNREFR